jgi:hypothetical protein
LLFHMNFIVIPELVAAGTDMGLGLELIVDDVDVQGKLNRAQPLRLHSTMSITQGKIQELVF